jgi:hypothetical protein
MAAEGWGHQRIAPMTGRPETTVRSWCLRFPERAGLVPEILLARTVSTRFVRRAGLLPRALALHDLVDTRRWRES